MSCSRRKFLKILSAQALLCGIPGCSREAAEAPARKIGLGKAEDFPLGFTELRLKRVGIFRDESGLRAISLVCTHQDCLLKPRDEGKFFDCPCHGSLFDVDGHALQGPATVDLPWFELSFGLHDELIVDLAKKVTVDRRLSLQSKKTPQSKIKGS